MPQLERNTPNYSKEIVGVKNILFIFILTFFVSFIVFHYSYQWIPIRYSPLISICSHVPMLIIPWIWIMVKSKTINPPILRIHMSKRAVLSLLIICSWLIPLQILGNFDVFGKPLPHWYASGLVSICLQIFFQGLFVGLSEEMLMRPVIHRSLQQISPKHFRFFKWKVSSAMLITALLFGVLHLGNLGHQPIDYTMFQVFYAIIIGLIIGGYYEKTNSFIGSVILHNCIDVTGVVMVLIASGIQ